MLLVNLLIARLGNTYQKYALNAEREFYFNRVEVALRARTYFALPPPLSLPFLLCTPSAWCATDDPHAWGNESKPPANWGRETVLADPSSDLVEDEADKREVRSFPSPPSAAECCRVLPIATDRHRSQLSAADCHRYR